MKLSEVIPFGRSLDEYKLMFELSESDLGKKIIGVGDGPASVNAEAAQQEKQYFSVDPMYAFKAEEIENRFKQVVDDVIAQVEATPQSWVWDYHKNPQGLRNNRIQVMKNFVADFDQGLQQERYSIGELPKLDFEDHHFDLALCSHFLFLYDELFSYEFHLESIIEMLRIANEVRIFPLLGLDVKKSKYVAPLIETIEGLGYTAEVIKVSYGFQKGGDEMLKVTRAV